MRPIFTGSPSIVQGGFNLDVENQHFAVGDTVPAGTLAIKDEVKRTVQVIKTAKVVEVDAETLLILAESHSKNSENFKPSSFNAGRLEN